MTLTLPSEHSDTGLMISRRGFFGVLAAPFVAALALKRKPAPAIRYAIHGAPISNTASTITNRYAFAEFNPYGVEKGQFVSFELERIGWACPPPSTPREQLRRLQHDVFSIDESEST